VEPLVFAGLMFFGVLVVFVSMIIGAQLDPVQARLQQIAVRPRTLEELELQRPLSERLLQPIIAGFSGLVGRFYPQNTVRGLSLRLKRAGMETTSTEFFLGVKGFSAIVGGVLVSGLVNAITGDPILCILIAAGLTWAAHSSVATVLLIMSLAYSSFVTPAAALALVLGANLGSAINPVLEGGHRDDRGFNLYAAARFFAANLQRGMH